VATEPVSNKIECSQRTGNKPDELLCQFMLKASTYDRREKQFTLYVINHGGCTNLSIKSAASSTEIFEIETQGVKNPSSHGSLCGTPPSRTPPGVGGKTPSPYSNDAFAVRSKPSRGPGESEGPDTAAKLLKGEIPGRCV